MRPSKKHTWIFCIVMLVSGCIILSCTPPQCGFASDTTYNAPFFKSSVFSGRSVVIVPLLSARGVDSTGLLATENLRQKIAETRRDIQCVPFSAAASKVRSRYGDTVFQAFVRMLYNGDVGAIQTADSIWSCIGEDYLMVSKMNVAHTIRTFSGSVRKKVVIDGELWDCRKGEAVFRATVNGICLTESVRDDKFILDGILEVYKGLPVPSPAYDTKAW